MTHDKERSSLVTYTIIFFSMLAVICLYLLIQLDESSKAVYSRAGEQEIRQLDLENIFNQKSNGKTQLFGTSTAQPSVTSTK